MSNLLGTERKRILSLITEKPEFRKDVIERIGEMEKKLREIRDKEQMDFEIFLGGSYAKGTDIKGSDVDIFLLFKEEFDPMKVLNILKKEFPEGREEYSDHPYLTLSQGSFSIDLVPGYKAKKGSDLRTAVDRTPFHVKFVKENFSDEMKDDAKILKQFMKGIGVYGAESSVQGFSGYVAELLIFKYGSFDSLISSAREWKIPCVLDDGGRRFEGASLVIADPVDRDRNAAANVSIENLATFILAAKLFSSRSWKEFLFPQKSYGKVPQEAVVIFLPCRKCNEETLIPNLRRVSGVLKGELESRGFKIIYTSVFLDKGGYIFLVPDSSRLGEAELHVGPPVTSPNVPSFLQKWGRGTKFGMPFMLGDRLCVLREREIKEISEAIVAILPRVKLSRDIDQNKILVIYGEDIDSIPDTVSKGFVRPHLGEWLSTLRDVEGYDPETKEGKKGHKEGD